MQAWAEIMNHVNIYNIKNAELQHMIYQTGMKVMENLAAQMMHKVENGEQVNSMIKLYQDYLNTSDKMYVALFETDEYSKLMAEVSSMKLSIKKSIDKQTEKMFENVPLATRSEMDEVYQIIYDLKKLVRTLQSQVEGTFDIPVAPKKTASSVKKEVVAKPVASKVAPTKKSVVSKKR
jgi:polyhydroxyalkanoate synthesis regulator phasin